METFPYTLYDNRADIDHNALQLNLVVDNKTIVTNKWTSDRRGACLNEIC